MLNMIDQCERYMAWIKHYASKLAYLLWLTPSGQVAHATLDRRLCRTRIFSDATKKRFSTAAPALPGRDMVILMKKLTKITGI